jgi:hypothetical protein
MQREPLTGKIKFSVGSVLPTDEHVNAPVRELFEENSLPVTTDDLTMKRGEAVFIPLFTSKA